ncbi:hypothetical protein QA596_06685 [Balneolales bacterium ANBcel1]|nr:hypothetical protein [Balneolales bacterium ANBcel1]
MKHVIRTDSLIASGFLFLLLMGTPALSCAGASSTSHPQEPSTHAASQHASADSQQAKSRVSSDNAAASGTQTGGVYIEDGVMYWEKTGDEVNLFGVNYYAPFSQTYRGLTFMGHDHKKAIDEDIYHLARMGMDAFRTHLYEIEITDSLGNLLQNHHLDLHDYSIYKMSERGIKTILTPTIYYDAGWPDGNITQPPGFANYITKGEAPQNPEYWPVIMNYLEQLIHHVNPYTGLSAIDDPDIIALEIDNEPTHRGADQTREFINTLADHLRESGWDKPIFYNISHNFQLTDAKLDTRIDGVTFQWYPAGLYEGVEKRSNYFPFVNHFTVPFEDDERYRNMAKMIYEFDPADNLNNYSLPMSARGFREAEMQFAAHFAYTALGIAHLNTDWRSHYLNLVYTPGRAVSMIIAGEVFRQTGLGESFDDYPADTIFGDFRMSHHLDLSEMNAETAFLYSNNTDTEPRNEAALERIAGVGSSPVVSYPGRGAYLLDKLDDGVWRLEVLPDAIPVRDPFEAPDYDKYVTHIEWRAHPLEIRLSDLGGSFAVRGLNEGNDFRGQAGDGAVTIAPGAYLLTRDGVSGDRWGPDSPMGNIRIGEYHAVPANAEEPAVWHRPHGQAEAGVPLEVSADVVGLKEGDTVLLQVNPFAGPPQRIEMEEVRPYEYRAAIPAASMTPGAVRYWIVIQREGDHEYLTFPGGNPSAPWRWNFYYDEAWQTHVVETGAPLEIWNAGRRHHDTFEAFSTWGSNENRMELVSGDRAGQMVRSVSTTQPTEGRHVLGYSTFIADHIAGITRSTLDSYEYLVVRAGTDYALPADLKVILVDDDANSYSAPVPVDGSLREHRIPLDSFVPDRYMLLPRAFPTIMEVWYATGVPGPVRPHRIEEIQFYIDTTGTEADVAGERYGFSVESAWLE